MNDREINNLIRMATEAEELERSVLGLGSESVRTTPPMRLVGHRACVRRRPSVYRVALLAGAAAVVGLAVRLSLPTPAPRPNPWPVVVKPSPAENEGKGTEVVTRDDSAPSAGDVAEPAGGSSAVKPAIVRAVGARKPGEASGVLGIFEDAAGNIRCVKWREHDFGDRPLDTLRPGELTAAMYGQHCVVGPHTMIAVGVTGPRDELPTTAERAQVWAQCIAGGEKSSCIDPSLVDSQSRSCLPHGLKVMVETLAMGR